MGYTTYENRNNPHVTIHRDGCGQLGKNGGSGPPGSGYLSHGTLADARAYAATTGLPVRECAFCKP